MKIILEFTNCTMLLEWQANIASVADHLPACLINLLQKNNGFFWSRFGLVWNGAKKS